MLKKKKIPCYGWTTPPPTYYKLTIVFPRPNMTGNLAVTKAQKYNNCQIFIKKTNGLCSTSGIWVNMYDYY